MKYNLTKEFKERKGFSLLTHIILQGMSDALSDKLVKKRDKNDETIIDVKMTVDGDEIDVQNFIDHWESQVHRMIKEEAEELMNDKFHDLLMDYEDELMEAEDKRRKTIKDVLKKWEKEKDNE